MDESELKYIRLALSLGWKALEEMGKLDECSYVNMNGCFLAFEKLAEKIGVDVYDILNN